MILIKKIHQYTSTYMYILINKMLYIENVRKNEKIEDIYK